MSIDRILQTEPTRRDPRLEIEPSERTPRLAPLPVAEMDPAWLAILERIPGDGLKGPGFPRNVLGTIMRSPATVGRFLDFWVTSKSTMTLSVREQELVILRMAVLYGSDYVWRHHVPVGREFGMSEDEIDAIESGEGSVFDSARERALLALVDELVEARTIRPPVWQAHATALDSSTLVDLVSLVAQYVFFALMNNAFQVEIESPLSHVRSLGHPDLRHTECA